ncbi:kinase-like domain-containing protein [Roridomyces roridus]|uniref:Kinase-like domain-containing protein n=1 Tax=Roridomyces roridus TaxID=1738132 RepID=A0AAD7FW89_9AGAR|nr:kinase-like domain-containing protein [Roridomyces roridus]
MPADDLDAQITAPLGAWPGDLNGPQVDFMKGRRLSASGYAIVTAIQDERLVLKFFYDVNTGKDVTPQVTRELRMMLLAGEDVSVTVEGRFIVRGQLVGFVMPHETALDLQLPKATKRGWIEQLQSLVRRMHDKAIIHGDIKPDNILLRKSDGRLVFCDWGASQLKAEAMPPEEGTYMSPLRCHRYNLPLCEADDLYALGATILHIWLGRSPFDPETDEFIEKDLEAVEDETLRSLIEMYLAEAPAAV